MPGSSNCNMPLVKFIDHDGTSHEVHVAVGTSIMRAAVDNGVRGIVGECGGSCVCATCHCYVHDRWLHKLGESNESERGLLECVGDPRPNSRLGCQVIITDDCDGIIVTLPISQS